MLQARVLGSPELTSEQEKSSLRDIERSCATVLFEISRYLEAQRDESASVPAVSIEVPVVLREEDQGALGSLLSMGQELIKILVRMRDEMLRVPMYKVE